MALAMRFRADRPMPMLATHSVIHYIQILVSSYIHHGRLIHMHLHSLHTAQHTHTHVCIESKEDSSMVMMAAATDRGYQLT